MSGDFEVVSVSCNSPEFEVGSSRLLSFAKVQAKPKPSESTAKVWSIADVEDDDIDLMDQDELLDEEDLAKPDQASLRGT